MAGTTLRKYGTIMENVPIIKRATGRLSDGRAVMLMIDQNNANGTANNDQTGVAKICLYLSSDSTRTAWPSPSGTPTDSYTPTISYTPPVAPSSATFRAVASMQISPDNSIWVAWVGTDNSLNLTKWTYSAGVITFSATQTVVAADATIVRKYRCIDLDLAGNSNPIIGTYEAKATSGQGAWARFYIRRNDNTTWIKACETDLMGTLFIRDGSEDMSVSWCLDGIVSNVGKFLQYHTSTRTTSDFGDTVREWSFNTSTGATNSATNLGQWFDNVNANQAAGTRRGWIYKLTTGGSALYLWAGSIGTAVPQFFATKLTTGNYAPPLYTRVGQSATVSLQQFFRIDPSKGMSQAVATSYVDNRLVWAFCSVGLVKPRLVREVMFRYNLITDYQAAFVDSNPRPADGYYYFQQGPFAVYGGDNSRLTSGSQQLNFSIVYGQNGDPNATPTAYAHESNNVRFVSEDVYDAPQTYSPAWPNKVHINKPSFQVRINPAASYNNLYGKVDIQIASDNAFTTNLRTLTQRDSSFTYYGNIETEPSSTKIVTVDGSVISSPLFQGSWWWRARLISDKGTVGAWSAAQDFDVEHLPIATPVTPKSNTVNQYPVSGNVTFTWKTSDTEPTDTQTAYYLKVTRTDTGVLVVDTGWVTTSAKTATVAISGTLKEIPLQWVIAVKDGDGAAGPFSSAVPFLLADPPVVVITSPVGTSPAVLNANTGFETNTTNWTASGGALTRSTTHAQSGTAAGLLTPDGVTAAPFIESEKVDIVDAGHVDLSAWYWIGSAYAGGISLSVNWYNASNILISNTPLVNVATAVSSTFTNMAGGADAPATAVKASIVLKISGTPSAATTIWFDNCTLSQSYVSTALPTVSWTYSSPGSRLQRAYRVLVTDPMTGLTVADTGWFISASTTYVFTSNILRNLTAYKFEVDIMDTAGLITTQTTIIQTQWTHPAQPSPVTVTQDGFKAVISWDITDQDTDFITWRVWRRYQKPALVEMDFDDTVDVWYLVLETTDPSVGSYNDYLVPLNTTVQYAVTQLVDRFGSLIDSIIGTTQSIVVSSSNYYFVPEVPVGTIASYQATNVTADSFTDEVEQETIHVIGRGRQVQVGDDLSYMGTLGIKLRNPASARGDREFLEYLSSSKTNNVYIRSPFGDVLLVKLGNISFTRLAGVGITDATGKIADMGDLTVPYLVVISNDIPVTRLS